VLDEAPNKRRADEAGTAGNQNTHLVVPQSAGSGSSG
jgi:hypothetical protein